MKINYFNTIVKALLGIAVLSFLIAVISINLFHYTGKMDADIASEGLMARTIWQHKSLYPEEWFWSSENRIFYVSTFAALFYGITGSMQFSMGIACVIAAVCMLGAVFYLLKVTGLKATSVLLGMLAFLAVPINDKFLELTCLYAGYYAVNIIVMLFTLGYYIKLIKIKTYSSKAGLTVLLICAFMQGCSGLRGILNIYAPLCIVESLRLIITWYKVKFKNYKIPKGYFAAAGFTCMLFLANLAGLLPFGKGNSSISKSIRDIPDKFKAVMPSILEILGFTNFESSKIILYILLGSFIIMAIVLALYVLAHFDPENGVHLMLAFLWAAPLLAVGLQIVTTIEVSFRYTFIFVINIGISLAVIADILYKKNRHILSAVLISSLFLFGGINLVSTYLPLMSQESDLSGIQRMEIIKWMKEQKIDNGYASFYNAGPLTMEADGQIQISPLDDIGELTPCKWLSDRTWYPPYVPMNEPTAYIINKEQIDKFELALLDYPDIKSAYQTDNFMIYVSKYNHVKAPD